MTYDATLLRTGRYAVHPVGCLGTCGWVNGVAWQVRYINARNAVEAIRKALKR